VDQTWRKPDLPGQHGVKVGSPIFNRLSSASEGIRKLGLREQSPRKRAATTRAQTPALLKGLLFGPDGAAMSPTHTRKGGRLYRYYISQSVMKRGTEACPIRQVPAAEIERIVIEQIRSLLQTPEVIVQTWRAARKTDKHLAESDVRSALLEFEPLWKELFPAEQARIVELLVERVDLQPDGIDLRLRVEGLTSLCSELRDGAGAHQEAA
jgi:site-specific DNA recombinase